MILGIFHKAFANPPEELKSPTATSGGSGSPKLPAEALSTFLSGHPPENTLSINFGSSTAIAYALLPATTLANLKENPLFCGYDDIYCLFKGRLNNLCQLIRQYGLSSKCTNEAMVAVEAYKAHRDRGPYPADQIVKDFDDGCSGSGGFCFVLYDSKAGTVFTALGSDGAVKMYWGIAADGSAVISDEINVVKDACGKSFAPFPTGCMFHSEGGLMSFEHPMHKMRPVPRVDSEGAMCGSCFKVDVYTRINSMPRVGSSSNWTEWDSHS